jgi:phospholipase C
MMPVDHVFVLMLENRSLDQMLGFAQLRGKDAESGRPTSVEGLSGAESNPAPAPRDSIKVTTPSEYVAPADPGHEFPDVLEQLCGKGGAYSSPTPPAGSKDPNINLTGFVTNFAGKYPKADPATPMKCFTTAQLPVLTTLAQQFAVCDHWFSSIPGPTWPNRFFVHAATSGGLDHSPSLPKEFSSMAGGAYKFANGTIYDLLDNGKLDWAVYTGDDFPQALHMERMTKDLAKFRPLRDFKKDLKNPSYSKSYVFIEPDWHPFTHFKGGTSQHPLDDVTGGEALIKEVYETIRSSPVWESSMLVITYDEHGGFFDHVVPPTTVEPGDSQIDPNSNRNGFNFRQLGVRVPAIIVSPLIGKGVIDHRVYDHSSVPATVEGIFGLPNLTQRDKQAAHLDTLLTLHDPRMDAPETLPEPANSGGMLKIEVEALNLLEEGFEKVVAQIGLRTDEYVDPALAGFVHIALLRHLAKAPAEKDRIIAEARQIKSDADALLYIQKVRKMLR